MDWLTDWQDEEEERKEDVEKGEWWRNVVDLTWRNHLKRKPKALKKNDIRRQIRGRRTIADVGMGNAPPNGLYNTTVS